MTLRIVRADAPITVERLNICIYAPPGVGKTSLAFTAADPILLDFDQGVYRASNRKDSVPVSSWRDVEELSIDDLVPYKTVIMDTAGRALDFLSANIIAKNPKMGKGGGSLSLQGYGELKVRFSHFVKLLNSAGKDVITICHMDEQRNGDDVIERLDAQGSSKNEIYKTADAMGRIFVKNGKRFLDFSPREGSFGKNPGQLEELEIPHPSLAPHFLAETIAAIKSNLNQLSEQQLQAQAELDEWQTAIAQLQSVDEFNQIVPTIKTASPAARATLHKRATELGFVFDKAAKQYQESANVA